MSNFQIDITDFSNGQIDNTNPQDPKWEGTGIFDVIIKAANENIKIQHKTSRITGAEYAEVYLGTMQSAISEAMKFVLQNDTLAKELELKQAQIAKINAERDLVNAQIAAFGAQQDKELQLKDAQISKINADKELTIVQALVYPEQQAKDIAVKDANIDLLNRQKEGFDDNKHQKLFEAQMNAWALMFSSGLLTTQPKIISNDSASSLYNVLKPATPTP